MFCVNSLSVCLVNTSLTCYAAGCSCLPPVVCVDVLRDECAALSCMSLHQPFIRAHLCARSNVLSPLNLSPFHSLLIPGAHTYTQHRLVIWLALWSLHLWRFFSLHLCQPLICPPYPPFLALAPSILDHDLTQQNLTSSRCLPECKFRNVINLFDFYQVTLLWWPKAKH